MSTSRTVRRTAQAFALVAAAAVVVPATASAEPAPSPFTHALETLAASPNPDKVSLQAAESMVGLAKTDAASPTDVIAGYQDAVNALQQLGIEPFLYPTAAPFCSSAAGLPLDLAPAVAGAVPGPWPNFNIPLVDPKVVNAGETLFAFVPAGISKDGPDTTGMQVAWFNISTLQGGFVPMGTISQAAANAVPASVPDFLKPVVQAAIDQFFAAAVPMGGVRAVPVKTGSGTVLAAVFGTVANGTNSCFFFPTVGVTNVG